MPQKNLSALFRGITSKQVEDFYFLSSLHPFRRKNKLKEHENACKNHDHFYIPKEDKSILKYNQGEKSIKISFIIYPD